MLQPDLSTLTALLVNFSPMFTKPSYDNFVALVRGWILCPGRRSISRVIQLGGFDQRQRRHHSAVYRFFSRAVWKAGDLGETIFRLVLRVIPKGWDILLLVDDTLCRKGGAHIWGAGMHHDPLLSNYGRGRTLIKHFSFGHSWVILCLCIPLPWNKDRGMAIPVNFRLYEAKKQCPKDRYRKRTELARQMINEVQGWVPGDRRIYLIADTEYSCETVVKDLPQRVVFVGTVNMKAALYAPPQPRPGRGRKPKKGKRLLSPLQMTECDTMPWKERTILLYGSEVKVLTKSQTCLWYTVAGTRLVHVIVTRDPKGRIDDRAYFSTDAEMTVDEIARKFSFRWTQEEMHRNVKQHLGLADPQNGWWHRPAGKRKDSRTPGPQPHATRGETAVAHTAPLILTVYAMVVLWYLDHGSPQDEVRRARKRAPWYRHKTHPSFGDMLAALRRALWAEQNFDGPDSQQGSSKLHEELVEILSAA